MLYEDALSLAIKGTFVTRKGMEQSFLLIRDGKTLKGHYMGESSFIESRQYSPSREDLEASDWMPFSRIKLDDWEGCDMPYKDEGKKEKSL